MEKNQLSTKYKNKKLSEEQEKEVEAIQKEKKISFLEAKHIFFESKKTQKSEPKIRKSMSIKETKLGVTFVLSKGDCVRLGYNEETVTSIVIQDIRAKLGLPPKQIKK